MLDISSKCELWVTISICAVAIKINVYYLTVHSCNEHAPWAVIAFFTACDLQYSNTKSICQWYDTQLDPDNHNILKYSNKTVIGCSIRVY